VNVEKVMGKASGVVSSAIFVGLFAILIYFCCRVKRRGAVIQQRANNFDNTAATPAHQRAEPPQYVPGGLVGYPYPQQSYVTQGQPLANGIYGPTVMPASVTGGHPYPYPPYPMNNASIPQSNSNLPYPANPGNGMPTPGIGHNFLQQSSAPYPTAPSNEDYDKPPSYEDVIRQQH